MKNKLYKKMYSIEMNGVAIIATVTLILYGLLNLLKDIVTWF